MKSVNKVLVSVVVLASSFGSQAEIISYQAGSDICFTSSCTQLQDSYDGNATIRQGAIKNGGMDAFDIFGYWSRYDGLDINRQVDVLDGNVYRFVDTFTNNNNFTADLTMRFKGTFGSGYFTQVESQTDTSIVVHDGGQETPVIGYSWGNNDWVAENTSFTMNRGAITNLFDIVLEPLEAMTVVQFISTSRADAEYEVDRYGRHEIYDSSVWAYDIAPHVGNVNGTLAALMSSPNYTGLSDHQLDTIVNFGDGYMNEVPEEPADPVVSVDAPTTAGIMAMGMGMLLLRRRV